MGYAIAVIRANFPLYATSVTIAHYPPLFRKAVTNVSQP